MKDCSDRPVGWLPFDAWCRRVDREIGPRQDGQWFSGSRRSVRPREHGENDVMLELIRPHPGPPDDRTDSVMAREYCQRTEAGARVAVERIRAFFAT